MFRQGIDEQMNHKTKDKWMNECPDKEYIDEQKKDKAKDK